MAVRLRQRGPERFGELRPSSSRMVFYTLKPAAARKQNPETGFDHSAHTRTKPNAIVEKLNDRLQKWGLLTVAVRKALSTVYSASC